MANSTLYQILKNQIAIMNVLSELAPNPTTRRMLNDNCYETMEVTHLLKEQLKGNPRAKH